MGCGVWGLRFGVWGLGFGFRVVGFGVWILRFGVPGCGGWVGGLDLEVPEEDLVADAAKNEDAQHQPLCSHSGERSHLRRAHFCITQLWARE